MSAHMARRTGLCSLGIPGLLPILLAGADTRAVMCYSMLCGNIAIDLAICRTSAGNYITNIFFVEQ